jgi:hypothetical protein
MRIDFEPQRRRYRVRWREGRRQRSRRFGTREEGLQEPSRSRTQACLRRSRTRSTARPGSAMTRRGGAPASEGEFRQDAELLIVWGAGKAHRARALSVRTRSLRLHRAGGKLSGARLPCRGARRGASGVRRRRAHRPDRVAAGSAALRYRNRRRLTAHAPLQRRSQRAGTRGAEEARTGGRDGSDLPGVEDGGAPKSRNRCNSPARSGRRDCRRGATASSRSPRLAPRYRRTQAANGVGGSPATPGRARNTLPACGCSSSARFSREVVM